MDFASSTRAAEDRTRWKGIVVTEATTFQGYGKKKIGEVKSKLDNSS